MSNQKTDKLNVAALLKAIEIAGSMRNLCTQLGVSYQSILDWKSARRAPSPFNCLKIETVTDGKVKKEDILPNYPWNETKTDNSEKLEIVKKMLGMGMSKENISEATGLSIEEIEKL